MSASNSSKSVNIPGVAVKASFQSKVWVGGRLIRITLISLFTNPSIIFI